MNAQTKVETDNLALWNAVSKTNPAHTKRVNQRGGFTAIAAHSQIMEATRQFGPIGIGWGYDASLPMLLDGLVTVSVTLWHGSRDNYFGPMPGAAELRGSNGKIDHDAPKKATTDALTKLLSQLGFNADVFLGLFDDSKYVQQVQAEFEEREAANDPANDPRREPAAREVLEGPHKSKTALRTAINNLIAKVREAETVIALNELLKGAKETIDEANRYWPSLVEGHPDIEEDIGLKGAVTLRRQHLAAQPAEDGQYKMLIDSMKTCTSHQDLADWTATNAPLIEELDGVEARSFQLAYDLYASGLKAVATVAAG